MTKRDRKAQRLELTGPRGVPRERAIIPVEMLEMFGVGQRRPVAASGVVSAPESLGDLYPFLRPFEPLVREMNLGVPLVESTG